MLKDINWIVPFKPQRHFRQAVNRSGAVSSTTNGKIDCPDLLGQAGDNIYANNELVGRRRNGSSCSGLRFHHLMPEVTLGAGLKVGLKIHRRTWMNLRTIISV